MFSENDAVMVTTDNTSAGITAGEIGTIVCVFKVPNEAYEVEFLDEDGTPRAQLTLLPEELVLLS